MNPEIIVVGTSLGGLKALETLLGGLAAGFPLPIALVQHRSTTGRELLAAVLQRYTSLTVRDAEDKDRLEPANVYVAPADYHLLIEPGHCALSLEAPVCYARPSIDVLFESAADAYGAGVIAVVLTGNNADGARGAARVKSFGGMVIAQDPNESESATMPRSTITAVKVDQVLKISEIADCLNNCCQPRQGDQHGTK